MRAPFRSLLWPGLGAAAVHLAIGWTVLEHWHASAPALHTVFSISLVPAAVSVKGAAIAPRSDEAAARGPAAAGLDREVVRPATRDADLSKPGLVGPAARAPVSAQPPEGATRRFDSVSASVDSGVDVKSQVEHFYAARELSRLPALPGDPLIDLGDEAAGLDGSVELRLYIDETGRVVASHVESSEGLPASVSDKLTSAFAGYPYVPGQRNGQAVKSDVTLVIGVRDGQPAGAVSR